ncbi:MAG TPA: hypothetical protein VLF17_00315 [Candidatus Nitrosotenuis sp.]|nr:hypothetical protein [Candidatus Nitrosotenuis sp.]
MNSDKRFLIFGLVGGFVALAAIFGYASMGYVRAFNIFWPEEVRQTLEFQNVDGKTVVVGTVGNAGINPSLIMRTGGYSYIITVVNKDTVPHRLYVDTVNASTKLLQPDEDDQIIIRSKYDTKFNYYDIANGTNLLGTIQVVHVIPLDKLEANKK